jgi:hypothetical protein
VIAGWVIDFNRSANCHSRAVSVNRVYCSYMVASSYAATTQLRTHEMCLNPTRRAYGQV